MDFEAYPKYNPAHIPDYLIYDEMKRQRERDAWQRERLELPLYQPNMPKPKNPTEKYEDPTGHDEDSAPYDDESSDRGVLIIDMNDLVDDDPSDDEN